MPSSSPSPQLLGGGHIVVYRYEGQHYTVGAVHHHAQTDPSPMSYGLWAGCIPVMTHSKQKDCKLDLDGGLGDV